MRGTLGRSPVEQCREVRAPRARGAGKGRAADVPGRHVTAPQLPGNGAGRRAGGSDARGVGVGAAGLQRELKRAAPSSGLRGVAKTASKSADSPAHWLSSRKTRLRTLTGKRDRGPPPWTGEGKNHTGSGIGFKKDLFN